MKVSFDHLAPSLVVKSLLVESHQMLVCRCDVPQHGAGHNMHVAGKSSGTAAIHWHIVTSSIRMSYI